MKLKSDQPFSQATDHSFNIFQMNNDTENDFSPQQSLQLIESMINRAKDKYAEDGFMYLVWGWLVFGGSLMQFLLLHTFHYPKHYLVWLITIPAFIYQFFSRFSL